MPKQPVNPCTGAVLRETVVTFIIITLPAITVVTLLESHRDNMNLFTAILDTQQLAQIIVVVLRVFLATHCLSGGITVEAATLDGL